MDSRLYSEIGAAVKQAEENGGDLTTKNLFYVAKVAKDLSAKTGADFDMLFSEGVIAMKKSEEKYDPEKNDSFVKFAGVSVRGYMLNAINRQGSLVHIPVNHQKGFKKGQEAESDVSSIKTIDIDAFNMANAMQPVIRKWYENNGLAAGSQRLLVDVHQRRETAPTLQLVCKDGNVISSRIICISINIFSSYYTIIIYLCYRIII